MVDDSTVARLTADGNGFFGLALSIARNNTVCGATISETVEDDEVDDADVDEATLELWQFVEEWSAVPESTVDTDENAVSALLEEFDPDGGVFGPFGGD